MAFTPSAELLLSLITEVYAAAADSKLWQPFLHRLEDITGGSRSYILSIDHRRQSAFACANNFDPAIALTYSERFAAADPLVIAYEEARKRAKGDFIGSRPSVMKDHEYHAMPMFHEIISAQNDLHLCVMMARLGPSASAALAIRRARNQPDFDPAIIDLLASLTPHLRQALQLQARLQEFEDRADLFSMGADAHGIAMIALDTNGHIVNASSRAEALLAKGDGLTVRGGQLCAARPEQSSELKALIHSAVGLQRGGIPKTRPSLSKASTPQGHSRSNETLSVGGAMLLPRRYTSKPLQFCIAPFVTRTRSFGRTAAAIAFLGDDAAITDSTQILSMLYQVTPTEARVARQLLLGDSVKEIADILHLSEAAVRFHLKGLFQRTGTRRQSELLRLLANIRRFQSELSSSVR